MLPHHVRGLALLCNGVDYPCGGCLEVCSFDAQNISSLAQVIQMESVNVSPIISYILAITINCSCELVVSSDNQGSQFALRLEDALGNNYFAFRHIFLLPITPNPFCAMPNKVGANSIVVWIQTSGCAKRNNNARGLQARGEYDFLCVEGEDAGEEEERMRFINQYWAQRPTLINTALQQNWILTKTQPPSKLECSPRSQNTLSAVQMRQLSRVRRQTVFLPPMPRQSAQHLSINQ